jgi:ABC-type sugar transport system ATPase subunit
MGGNARDGDVVKKFVKLLDIRTPSETQEVRLLSGGNQQKIVVAKDATQERGMQSATQREASNAA